MGDSGGITWVEGTPFQDTIDGYFPLRTSLAQMLERQGFHAAVVTIDFAPIIHVSGLPADAPVPLNIRSGQAGLIHRLSVCVTAQGLSGFGYWRWLTQANGPPVDLGPDIRLAEPAFLSGIGFGKGDVPAGLLGGLHAAADERIGAGVLSPDELRVMDRIWGPFPVEVGRIVDATDRCYHGDLFEGEAIPTGFFVLQRAAR
ncbi:hypothetical protein [Aestuariivita boseongensis]|uniref:hypothetical protein n=1 Tax=Aestuariivita boseongensis TaxID=1470562 RepID=UPI00067FB61F|nr:hypothetical protein [Aestuariivita boseongensis]